jgi:hypothetical protein
VPTANCIDEPTPVDTIAVAFAAADETVETGIPNQFVVALNRP